MTGSPPLPLPSPPFPTHSCVCTKKNSYRERKRERAIVQNCLPRSGGGPPPPPPPPSPATLILHPQRKRQQKGRSPFAAIIPPFAARPLRPLAKIEDFSLSLLFPFPFPRKVERKISLAIHLLFFFACALSSDFLVLFLPLFECPVGLTFAVLRPRLKVSPFTTQQGPSCKCLSRRPHFMAQGLGL